MANRNCLGSNAIQATITAIVICWFSLAAALLQAQPNDAIEDDLRDGDESTSTFGRRPFIEPLLVRNEVAYVNWPESLVGQETLMAIDLSNASVKWTHLFDAKAMIVRPFGEFVFVRSPGAEIRQDWMLRADSGEATENHEISHDLGFWMQMPVANDHYLISDHVYEASTGKVIRKLSFFWDEAFIDGEKLYTIGGRDGEPSRERSVREQFLRRTDLMTGITEREVPLKSTASLNVLGASFGLIAGRGDQVVLQFTESITWRERKYLLLGFDMVRGTVLWKTAPPCSVREARFREDGQLECQCRGVEAIYSWARSDNLERQPLLVNLETGSCLRNEDWRDPFAFVNWYSGPNPIGSAQRNDRYTLAVLDPGLYRNRIPIRGDVVCFDSASGRLIWHKELYGRWPATSDVLGDHVVRPIEGGLEIIDVATGLSRTIKAKDVGLTLVPETQLPEQFRPDPVPPLFDNKHDWWQDRLLLWTPALPIVAWGFFQLLRWRNARNPKTKSS